MTTVLAGDIGGTKTLLALFRADGDGFREIRRQRYPSDGYAEFVDLLDDFLRSAPGVTPDATAIGVAGPVIGEQCHTTNLPWILRADDLRRQTGSGSVFLLNDLQATAYGMLHLAEDEFAVLNEGAKGSGNAAVIAAGTGLGEAILCFDAIGNWQPVATEGGHCDFAPQNALQDSLLHWLREHYPAHVSVERILSGPGLESLYQFLAEQAGKRVEPLNSREISARALAKKDDLCRQTLLLFAEIYGAEAGNLALKSLARGGVFVGGGIAPKILPILQEGHFMRGFLAKGRFTGLLERMPVKVSLNEETALLGAAHYAIDHARRHGS